MRSKASPLSTSGGANAYRPRNLNQTPASVVAEGYCLVSLRDQRQWVLGDPNIQILINDRLYLFAGIRQRDIFAASPERYLPVLDGDSIVAFAETGKRVPGDLQFGMTFRDRIYFFRNATEQSRFQNQSERFLNADLVDQGHCPVSKIDEEKLVPGIPETVLTLDGLRYFFASTMHRKLFAANPQRYVESINATYRDLQSRTGLEKGQSHFQGLAAKSAQRVGDSPDDSLSKDPAIENDQSELESEFFTRPAISGYCPVSIRKQGVWVRGKSRYKATFDGKVYHMAGTEELSQFRENPREFMPVLGGDSIVAFADKAQRIPGSAYQPLIAGDRLFLFADATEKQAFKDNPEQYENADLAHAGNCIVTLIDEQREEPGLPDFETVFQGFRYWFASKDLMGKFLAEPTFYADQLPVAQ